MNLFTLTNNEFKNLAHILEVDNDFDTIYIASAFFSYSDLIKKWLDNNKTIYLLLSLRLPTNYYSIKDIKKYKNIKIKFLGNNFHSKFIIFSKNNEFFKSVIGSSNFTAGGLKNNIETNIVLDDIPFTKNLYSHFDKLWKDSYSLEPPDLEEYKNIFDNFNLNKNNKELDVFATKLKGRNLKKPKTLSKEAQNYSKYWDIVDDIKDIVGEISKSEYPHIPVYLVLDHFWHWVKKEWGKDNNKFENPDSDKTRELFKIYCQWDKSNKNYVTESNNKSINIFKKHLDKKHIDKLNILEAEEIYKNLHSGESRTKRFNAAKKFIEFNSISEISSSFKYLLYSADDIDIKINHLTKEQPLKELGLSGVQELLGWVFPEKYPIRNKKADTAIKLLGYSFY